MIPGKFPFSDRQRKWLFTIDIFACAHRFNQNFRVPMIRGCDVNNVDLAVERGMSRHFTRRWTCKNSNSRLFTEFDLEYMRVIAWLLIWKVDNQSVWTRVPLDGSVFFLVMAKH